MRYTLAPGTTEIVAFMPARLPDSQISGSTAKHACLGAMLLGNFGSLPTTSAAVLWDVNLSLEPPASVKPLKPKLWLMGRLQLLAGVYYLLEASGIDNCALASLCAAHALGIISVCV